MIRVTFACFVLLLVAVAMSSAAIAEDDDDKNEGKEAVESVSGPASTKDAERSVQSDHENDSPIRVAVKSSSGARDEHESARFAMRSNQLTGSNSPVVAQVVTAGKLRLIDMNLFLDLERKAVTGRLRIEEIPVSVRRFDMVSDPIRSQPPVLIVPNASRMPVLIADVAPRVAAKARPPRQGSAAAGFSDDDLALRSPTKTGTEFSTSEADAPAHLVTKMTVNQHVAKSPPSPPNVVPPTSTTLDVTPQPAVIDRETDVLPVPILARTRLRIRTPLRYPKSDAHLNRSRSTNPKPVITVPDSHALSTKSDADLNRSRSTNPKPVITVPDSHALSTTPKVEPRRNLRAEPPIRITRQMWDLRSRINSVLRFYLDKPLNTKDHGPWSVMHSILGYGVNAPLAVDHERGRRTTAIGWMCWNNPCKSRRLFYLDDGYIIGREGPGFQGHPGQFLAMLAQVRLTKDYPMQIEGRPFSVEDLVEAEKRTCGTDKELTFKLIGLSHYLESDAMWLNEHGETWNIPKILQIELAQPVNGAACGGTHRVMACSYAVLQREQRGEPLFGPYLAAKKYMRNYQQHAKSLQNRDGSFSSEWFKRTKKRTDRGDKDRKLQTTGHILEWLVITLPRNKLSDRYVVRATEYLTNTMIKHRYDDWKVGPRGHALRALAQFERRVFSSPLRLAHTKARPAK